MQEPTTIKDRILLNWISADLNLPVRQVSACVELLDTGNTVPFIARYRQEATGGLDENQIRDVQDKILYYRALEARKATILESIAEQGKLTPELQARITESRKLQEVEDLYLPYKPKRRTRGVIAREKGLEPLALMMLRQEIIDGRAEDYAQPFVNKAKSVLTGEEALQGARDIVAEIISDDADVRAEVREFTRSTGILVSRTKDETDRDYEMYHDYREPIAQMPPHRILAVNRGEKEEKLRILISVDKDRIFEMIGKRYLKNPRSVFYPHVDMSIRDSYDRLIALPIEREVRNIFTEMAEEHAIKIFAENLRHLLLQPPIKDKIIMGIDPGYRTGCKVAVIDTTGKYIEGGTIFPHEPQNRAEEAKAFLRTMIRQHKVNVIAIGNGTASRETEQLVTELVREMKEKGTAGDLVYTIVSEAGASVYSASKIAQQEFPDLEAAQRGNISIARRLLDPLAELVKIDPRSIGVGQYQHDCNQKRLAESLTHVVESAVNYVGVNLNTASAALLSYVSGLSSRTAQAVVSYRDQHGKFHKREQLLEVPGIGPMAFQQAAGFLRIPDGDHPLDNTAIHPESYEATEKLLRKLNIADIRMAPSLVDLQIKSIKMPLDKIAGEIGVGVPTLKDILDNLKKPGRDPREELPPPIFKSDVLKIEDLKPGMTLKGTVRNVVDFGAFVDIGVKQDGLVHISEMANRYIKHPLEVVKAGQIVHVRVLEVDIERNRIKLSMKI